MNNRKKESSRDDKPDKNDGDRFIIFQQDGAPNKGKSPKKHGCKGKKIYRYVKFFQSGAKVHLLCDLPIMNNE
jgi:hypothetical protein